LFKIYKEYKAQLFPKLLQSPTVIPEDKLKIQDLLKKPSNLYIRRHSAITEKSKILREHVLKQHSGWSGRSQMHLKYLHYFGNGSSHSLLQEYGIIPRDEFTDNLLLLKPKQYPTVQSQIKKIVAFVLLVK
jgi:hypothetical protein